MKLYRNAEGTWVGTQAEAGNKDIIEVPVDKPGLLEWLNANCRESVVDNQHSAGHTDSGAGEKEVTCERCKWTPKLQRSYVESLLHRLNFEAVETALERLNASQVGRALSAVLDRAKELADASSKPSPPTEPEV